MIDAQLTVIVPSATLVHVGVATVGAEQAEVTVPLTDTLTLAALPPLITTLLGPKGELAFNRLSFKRTYTV